MSKRQTLKTVLTKRDKVILRTNPIDQTSELFYGRNSLASCSYDEHGSAGYDLLDSVGRNLAKVLGTSYEKDEDYDEEDQEAGDAESSD